MSSPAERLVGRSNAISLIERALDELDLGRPGAIELVGEPGIGKTRLLRELAFRAEGRGHLVLFGSASEIERELPFSVFVDALDEYVGGVDPERLAALDGPIQAELAQVFPSLWRLGSDQFVVLQQERYRTHRAVRTMLEHLALTTPLVLLLDDVHWADSASIELFGALLRRPPAAVLTAVALRPHQTPERLSAALARAHRAAALTRIELEALTLNEARQFLGETVDSPRANVLFAESGGNPFYLEQLARSLERADTGLPASDVSLTDIVPPAVGAALSEELSLLSAETRLLFDGAAVAGDPFEVELAAAAAGSAEAAAMVAVDELLRLDLVRPTEVPRRFRFRHPLVRRAVYEAAPAGWRLLAHERCAEALAARGAAASVRAHHVERSARQGDVAAVDILREAGEAAARLAPLSAARWYGAALRLLPASAPGEQRLALLFARAGGLAATGHFTESRADLLECVEIAMRDAAGWRVRAATACAAVENLLGLGKEAHGHLTAALSDLGGRPSPEAVDLMIELSLDRFYAGDFDAMHDWSGRAVDSAKSLGDRSLLGAALAIRAWSAALAGGGAEAQAHCDEATELIDELSDAELARRLDALAHLASADQYLDRFQAATRHGKRALAIGRATGQGELFPRVEAMLGGSLWIQGKPLEAGELFDEAVEAARLAGNIRSLAWQLFNRSFAALVAGEMDVALATAQESCELMEAMEPGPTSAFAAAALASAMLENGRPDQSVEVLLSGAGGEELRLIGGGWRARFLELLTRGLLASGRRPAAQRAAAQAQACADALALPSASGMAWLAAAALALDSGEPATAAERALAAASSFESVAALFDAARARQLAGRAFARAGDRQNAVREFELSAAAFDAFGSLRYRDQAERELGKLGRRPHRRSRPGKSHGPGIESLTERELEVARLVVDRRTNAQIAAELFLSQKTVETHLRNIFNKMGVTTRVALAKAVELADRKSNSRQS